MNNSIRYVLSGINISQGITLLLLDVLTGLKIPFFGVIGVISIILGILTYSRAKSFEESK